MKSLKALTAYLDGLRLYDKDQLESFVEDTELEWRDSVLSDIDNTRVLFTKSYTAVFSINDFAYSADLLFFHLLSWLVEHDQDFDQLGWPDFDIEQVDEDKVDLELNIRFRDDVIGRPDPDGDFQHDGESWIIIDSFEPDVAETLDAIEMSSSCD